MANERSQRRRRFGAVRKLPSGRWQARYRDDAGTEHTADLTFATKGDAGRWLSMVEADLERGDWRNPVLGRATLASWADEWLATTSHLRPKTRVGYLTTLGSQVLPALGAAPVAGIDTPMVRRFVADLLAGGAAVGTVVKARAVLRLVLACAVEGGALRANPADGVKVGRPPRREMVFLTADQVEDLAHAIVEPPLRPGGGEHRRTHYPELGTLVRFAAYSGLRAGEIGALRVDRLDLLRRRVDVVESLGEVPGHGLVFGPPKTYERRSVPLPAFLADELGALVAGREPDRFVFEAVEGGPLRHANFYRRQFRPAVAAAGVPAAMRFHDLRHTSAALLIAEGAHPLAIMRRLGHSSITTTLNVYGHLFPELEEALTERIDTVGRSASTTPPASVRPLR